MINILNNSNVFQIYSILALNKYVNGTVNFTV